MWSLLRIGSWREIRILREQRDIPESHPVLREPKAVRFRFAEEQRGACPLDPLCRGMHVGPRGLRAFRSRGCARAATAAPG